jgi:hypothetical protein
VSTHIFEWTAAPIDVPGLSVRIMQEPKFPGNPGND